MGAGGVGNPVAECVTVDDLDLDGYSDIITSGNGYCTVMRGLSTQPWTIAASAQVPISLHPSGGVGQIITAKLNADPYPDLIAHQQGILSVYLGTGTGSFLPTPGDIYNNAAGAAEVEPATGDVDGDGDIDIVLSVGQGIVVIEGDGAGAFRAEPPILLPNFTAAKSVAVAPLDDGDGDEIILGISFAGQPRWVIIWNNATTYDLRTLPAGTPASGYALVAAGDMDQDQDIDIAAAVRSNGVDGTLWALLSNGDGSFSETADSYCPVDPIKIRVASLHDERARKDIVVLGNYGLLYVAYPGATQGVMKKPTLGVGFGSSDFAIDRVGLCDGFIVTASQGVELFGRLFRTLYLGTQSTDIAPVIESPPIVAAEVGSLLTFKGTARDFERHPVTGLGADLSGLPSGNSAAFVIADSVGTFTWSVPDTVPPGGVDPVGVWPVTVQVGGRARTTLLDVLPSGTNMMATFTWLTTALDAGTYNVQFQARQGASTVLTTVTIVVQAPGAPSPSRSLPSRAPVAAVAAATITLYAPSSVTVTAGEVVSFVVSAGGASEITANIAPLPAGSDSWLSIDREPSVSAPPTIIVTPGTPATVSVSAIDPDFDSIESLDAVVSALPPGTVASFEPSGGNQTATLTVTLPPGSSGNYGVTFRARNAMVGQAGTVLQVAGASALPFAYWKLNGTGADERGVATLFYSGAYAPGNLGQGLAPQGSPATLGQSPIALGLGPGPFAIEMWMKTLGPLGGAATMIHASDFEGNRWGLSVADAGVGGEVRFFFDTVSGPLSEFYSSSNVADGAFHHVAVTYLDPTLSLYVDGIVELTDSNHPGLVVGLNGGTFCVGAEDFATPTFNGVLDELRLWDVARSGPDIAGSMGQELTQTITAVESETAPRYTNRLDQNRPNPFNPATTLAFELEHAGLVQLRIFDVRGRLVRTLREGTASAGPHGVRWTGDDDAGRDVGSGVYFAVFETQGFRQARRLVLLK